MRRNYRIIRCVVILLMIMVCVLSAPASATEPPAPPSAEPPVTPPPADRPAPGSGATPTAAAAMRAAKTTVPAPRVYRGWGFDTCRALSIPTMRAWLASTYRAVGVYYAGRARARRTQRNLNLNWVHSVSAMGLGILPVYVGLQSLCVLNTDKKKCLRMSTHTARRQGTADAHDAVHRARRLGLRAGSPLFLDTEAYDTRRPRCTRPTLSFVRAFDHEVRRQKYRSGFYSSAQSGITQVARARRTGTKDLPDVVRYARWRVAPTLTSEPVLGRRAWPSHRRIHQYAGNVARRTAVGGCTSTATGWTPRWRSSA